MLLPPYHNSTSTTGTPLDQQQLQLQLSSTKSRRPHPYKSLLRFARSLDDCPRTHSPLSPSHLATTLATTAINILCIAPNPRQPSPPRRSSSLNHHRHRHPLPTITTTPPPPPSTPTSKPTRRSSLTLHRPLEVARSRAQEHTRTDAAAAAALVGSLRVLQRWVRGALGVSVGTRMDCGLRDELQRYDGELREFFLGGEASDRCFVYDRVEGRFVPEIKRLEKVVKHLVAVGEALRCRVGVGGGRSDEVKSRDGIELR